MNEQEDFSEFDFQVEARRRLEALEGVKNKFSFLFASTPVGLEVLGNILVNLCFFGKHLDPNNAAQIGAYNVGVDLLLMCKVFDNKRMIDVINGLFIGPKEGMKDEKAE